MPQDITSTASACVGIAGFPSTVRKYGATLSLPCQGCASKLNPQRCPVAPQDSTSSILQSHVVHLIGAGQHALIPQYCCHLRKGARHVVYQIFLTRLTGAPMEDCRTAWLQADAWFAGWHGGDMVPNEMCLISEKARAQQRFYC